MSPVTQLVNEGARDPELALEVRMRLLTPRRQALPDMIDRAVTHGQLTGVNR
jgi:Tetracyclin repressor-like, C-terminal domain